MRAIGTSLLDRIGVCSNLLKIAAPRPVCGKRRRSEERVKGIRKKITEMKMRLIKVALKATGRG